MPNDFTSAPTGSSPSPELPGCPRSMPLSGR